MRYFVCFRIWPSFAPTFPFQRFERLDNSEFEKQLDTYAREQLRENKSAIIAKRRANKRKLIASLKARQGMFSPRPSGNIRRQTDQERHEQKRGLRIIISGCERDAPLICKVGVFLGWWGNSGAPDRMPDGRAASDRYCLHHIDGDDLALAYAHASINELNSHFARLSDGRNYRDDTAPFNWFPARFFLIEQSGIAESEAIQLAVNCARLHSKTKIPLAEMDIARLIAVEGWNSVLAPLLHNVTSLQRGVAPGVVEVESQPSTPLPKEEEKKPNPQRKPSANVRMIEVLIKKPESRDWSVEEWRIALGYGSKSTIHDTDTWRTLEGNRMAIKAGLVTDKRRKPRHNGSRTFEGRDRTE